ncbi:MAG: lipopolysaccharide biosynthesis protein, partial [Pseudonocardiaceae bacterium]
MQGYPEGREVPNLDRSRARPAGFGRLARSTNGLSSGFGYSGIAQASPLIANLALAPFLIDRLGLDRFGVWSLILIFLVTFTALDGGVGASLARFYAYHCARGDRAGAGRLAIGSLALFLTLGGLVSGACLLLAPTVVELLNIPAHLRGEAVAVLRLLGPLVALALVTNSATSLLQANARFRGLAGVSVCSAVGYVAGVLLVVDHGQDLSTLAVVTSTRYVILLGGGFWLGRRHISLRRPLLPDASLLREFRDYAVRMQLSGLTTFLNGEIDALVIAAVLPIRFVGIYAIGYQAASALRSLPLYAFPPILTRMTGSYAHHGMTGAVREFHALQARWVPAVLAYGAMTTSAVAFAVYVWLGPEFLLSGVVAVTLLAGYSGHVAITGMRTCFVRAIGRPGPETRYSWFATVCNLALTVPMAYLFGVIGVVAATVIGLLAGSLYFVVLCRRLADLRERRLPVRWALGTGLGVVV